MKLLVLGAGTLAHYLKKTETKFPDFKLQFASKTQKPWGNVHLLDIRNENAVHRILEKMKPDVVINAAVLGSIRECEKNPVLAEEINHLAQRNIVQVCNNKGIKCIYISTSSVFSGRKGNYSETDQPEPTTVYGQTKLRGEETTLNTGDESAVIRISSLYGDYPGKSDFIRKIITRLKHREKMELWGQVISPGWGPFIGEAVLKCAEKNVSGIWHVAGDEQLSRLEIGMIILEEIENNFNEAISDNNLIPVKTPLGIPKHRGICVEKFKYRFPEIGFPKFRETVKELLVKEFLNY